MDEFIYLGTTLPYQNSVQKKLRADWIQRIRRRIFFLPVC